MPERPSTSAHPVPAFTRVPAPGPIPALGAAELARAIRAGRVTCREVAEAYLARIGEANGDVNAIVALRPRSEVLAEADEHDALLRAGTVLGALHGVPMAPKDLLSVRGLVTTLGLPFFAARIAHADDPCAARLRAAGAIFLGRTASPELGLGSHTYSRVWGRTGNAFSPTRSAGGSSGGAAVALARHMLPVADGSDAMGSLRNPAAWNQVYGFRPSTGVVPPAPGAADLFTPSFAVNGPMARSPEDLELLFRVMAAPEPRVPFSLPLGSAAPDVLPPSIRVGWLGDLSGHLAIEPDLLAFTRRAAFQMAAIRDTAAHVEIADAAGPGAHATITGFDFDFDALWTAWLTLRHVAVLGSVRALKISDAQRRAHCKPELNWEVDAGLTVTLDQVNAANRVRTKWWRALVELFDTYDFLVLPSTQTWPFPKEWDWPREIAGRTMDTYHRWMEVVVPASMAGVPAASVPIGFLDGNKDKPAGIQVLAPKGQDGKLLALLYKLDTLYQSPRAHI